MAYSFAGAEVGKGQKRWIEVPVTTDADDRDVVMQACVIHGGGGPVFWTQGCLHGPEHVGAVAIRNFVRDLDPSGVDGTIIGIPVVNQVAFKNKVRTAPIDHQDLNRSFPGSDNGSFTEILADTVYSLANDHADYLIDIHTGGNEFIIPGYSIYPQTGNDVEQTTLELCRVADLPYTIRIPQEFLQGAMYAAMAKEGIPSIILESGGEGRLHQEYVDNAERALVNLACHLDMIDGEPEQRNRVSEHETMEILKAKTGGIFEAEIEGNERVQEGQTLARITDVTGEIKEEIESPYNGIAVAVRTYSIARPGDWVFELTPRN